MMQSRLCVLGRFSLELGQSQAPNLATQKARALLAYLISHHHSDVGRERLLEVLWPEIDPDRAKEGLRSALWSIRRAIRDAGCDPDDYVSANRSVIRWHAHTELDADQFLALARSEEPQQLEKALELYRGDYLEGDYEEWTVAERARLDAAYEALLARLVRISGSHQAAQLLLTRNPYDEPSYKLLIEAELEAGRIVSAQALAERCERALAEVGAQPSAHLRLLVTTITKRQIQAIPTLVLPFVGRESELGIVRDRLSGEGIESAALLISGEPGIGKSAFLIHAAGIAQSLERPVVSVRGFDTDTRPFGPFEELYRDLYDEPLQPLGAENRVDGAQRLAETLVKGLGPGAVISVDDAHALATEARRVLSAIAGQARTRKLTLLVATRSEGVSQILDTLASCSPESISLGPLRLDAFRAAVGSVVVENQETVANTVYERSGGHPLFAMTLLESLAQSGLLRADHGTYRLVGTLDEHVPLPKTLTTYIQARLRARGDTASAVAAALALEPAATTDDIIFALQLPESRVFDALDDLLAIGVVVQPASGPQLAFAHDLYREVAAASVNVGRRARLHRAFAERFGSSPTPDSSLRCARHLSSAGEPFAAGEAYYRAAREALEWGGWIAARDRCSAGIAGLEKLEHTPEVVALMARLKMFFARIGSALGDASAAFAAASDAVVLARRSGATDTALDAALARQQALIDAYDPEAVLASSREIVDMARDPQDGAAFAVAQADASWSHRLLGHEVDAVKAAGDADEATKLVDDWDVRCYALEQLVLAYVTWWRFEEAREAAARLLKTASSASRLAQAATQCTLAALDMALERHVDTSSHLVMADTLLRESIDRPRYFSHSSEEAWLAASFGPARVTLAFAALSARLAFEKGDADGAIAMASKLAAVTLPRAQQLARIFHAEAMFKCGTPSEANPDGKLGSQSSATFYQDVYSGNRSPELAEILLAAANRASDAPDRLLRALDLVEAACQRTPLDADHAFAQLARAASQCGALHVAARAGLRRDDYRAMRAEASCRGSTLDLAESSIR